MGAGSFAFPEQVFGLGDHAVGFGQFGKQSRTLRVAIAREVVFRTERVGVDGLSAAADHAEHFLQEAIGPVAAGTGDDVAAEIHAPLFGRAAKLAQ